MSSEAITNHLLNLNQIKIKEYNIHAYIKKSVCSGIENADFEVRINYTADKDPNYIRTINSIIFVDYSNRNPKEILLQFKEKILSIVKEQVEIDNDFIEAIKDINTNHELEKLEPFINKEYYSMFKSSIEKEVPVALSSEVLNRCTGKTSTLAYLAIERIYL
ncbi:metalloprotease [Staphylococcus phage CUB-A]|nr:metalloprotease [Staphylococcus phage CUB-A]